MNTKKIIFTVTVVLLVIAFAVSAFFVVNYIIEGKREEQMYAELAQQATATAATVPTTQATVPTATAATEPPAPTEPQILPDLQTYFDANDHTVGYIEIPGTKLSYPVLQTPDQPNYYLKRNFERNNSERGALYCWEAADINEPSDNITIFGHNMKDGSMFNSLMAYQQKSHWENNPIICFDTLYERHTYKIFAVFKTSANIGEGFSYHKFVDADSKEEYDEFVSNCKKLSFYDTGITPTYVDEDTKDKIICLSTCEYTLENGRFVVCAVRWT